MAGRTPNMDTGLGPDPDPPLLGATPRLPVSPPPPPPPPPSEPPTQTTPTPPTTQSRPEQLPPTPRRRRWPPGPGGPPPTTSSTASTDDDAEAKVPPQRLEDLTDALTQAADVVLVLGGQGLGVVHRRVTGARSAPSRWAPTASERRLILAPTSRIIARHVPAGSAPVADAVDAAFIAAGVGHYAARTLFDVEPPEPLPQEEP